MNILGTLTERVLPKRTKPIRAVVVHTTGETDRERVWRYYASDDGKQPHYWIDLDGAVRRFVHDDHVAYHVGIKDARARLYQLGWSTWREWTWDRAKEDLKHTGGEFTGYREWRCDFLERGYQSPLDLVTGAHPNSVSIGIELQQPKNPGPAIFSDAQYDSLVSLLLFIRGQHGVPLDKDHVLSHYACDPMNRCDAQGSTDPGRRFVWDRVWDGIGHEP